MANFNNKKKIKEHLSKRIYLLMLIPFLVLVFNSCSWMEYFVLVNKSNHSLHIRYTLTEQTTGIGIFMRQPEQYNLENNGNLIWESKTALRDTDTSKNNIEVRLEPNKAMIFGYLSNDKYTSFDQEFINDRQFNLLQLEIVPDSVSDKMMKIQPQTFDQYFKKGGGKIKLVISEK